jgi:hypothetical protein
VASRYILVFHPQSAIRNPQSAIQNRLACEPIHFRSEWVFSGIPAGSPVRNGGPAICDTVIADRRSEIEDTLKNHKYIGSCGIAAMWLAPPAFARTRIVFPNSFDNLSEAP